VELIFIYSVSHKSRAIEELGYLVKHEKIKEGEAVAHRVFQIASVGIFYLDRIRKY
jgi:hypothetical protein